MEQAHTRWYLPQMIASGSANESLTRQLAVAGSLPVLLVVQSAQAAAGGMIAQAAAG